MDTFVDYYQLLHVQPTAPAAVIKASYRTMLQKLNHHPDRGGDVEFAQLLNAAATTLCNSKTRALYDQLKQQHDDKNKIVQARDHSATTARGEADGHCTGERKESANHQQRTERNASDDSHNEQNSGQSESPQNEHLSLPPKPQCPFCLSPYPMNHTAFRAAQGYLNANRCQVCNAARTLITQVPESSSDELRRMHRQQHETPASLWTHWPTSNPVDAILTDFSPGGCAMKYSQSLADSVVIMLETDLFNAVCKVRHCKYSDNGQHAIGLEFLTLDMLARPGSLLIASA